MILHRIVERFSCFDLKLMPTAWMIGIKAPLLQSKNQKQSLKRFIQKLRRAFCPARRLRDGCSGYGSRDILQFLPNGRKALKKTYHYKRPEKANWLGRATRLCCWSPETKARKFFGSHQIGNHSEPTPTAAHFIHGFWHIPRPYCKHLQEF